MPIASSKQQRRRSNPSATRWYLREWLELYGKRQADLVRELDYDKAIAHSLWHDSSSSFNKSYVADICAWLKLLPHELFMEPALALRFRFAVTQGDAPADQMMQRLELVERSIRELSLEIKALRSSVLVERPRTFSVTVGPGYIRPDRRKPQNE